MSNDNLPSIDDYSPIELPSIDSVLSEQQLPSVEDFLGKEEVEEVLTEEVIEPEPQLEVDQQDLTEVLRLINDVRKDIPNIPEIKYYDDELEKIVEQIEEVRDSIPEVKYYDEDISSLKEGIENIPEIRYYDEEIVSVKNKINEIIREVKDIPEIRYYDEDLQSLKKDISDVRSEIPIFPKWVNEVNEVPDFAWIGKTFGVIDDDFIKVNDHLNLLKGHIDSEIKQVSETFDTKDFESRVDIKALTDDLKESKEKIYIELKEAALKIYEHRSQFKDDDRKLKKQVLSKLNETKQNIEKQITEYNEKQSKAQNSLSGYLDELKEDVINLPTVKYYDEDIRFLKKDISKLDEKIDDQSKNFLELYKLVKELKEEQKELNEGLLNIPPDEDNKDPLTPLDQKFATLKDLAANYRLFVNRVQEQLATFGGGGSVQLQYLEDISGIATNLSAYDGMFLKVDTSQAAGKNFKFASVSSASTTWTHDANDDLYTLQNVGIATTARSDYALYVGGNFFVDGDIEYDEVKGRNIDISGIGTINNLEINSGIVTAVAGAAVTYYGDGSNLTGKASIGLAIALG